MNTRSGPCIGGTAGAERGRSCCWNAPSSRALQLVGKGLQTGALDRCPEQAAELFVVADRADRLSQALWNLVEAKLQCLQDIILLAFLTALVDQLLCESHGGGFQGRLLQLFQFSHEASSVNIASQHIAEHRLEKPSGNPHNERLIPHCVCQQFPGAFRLEQAQGEDSTSTAFQLIVSGPCQMQNIEIKARDAPLTALPQPSMTWQIEQFDQSGGEFQHPDQIGR